LGAIILFGLTCAILIALFVNSKPIMGAYDATGEDFQSINKLGNVLLNEYMVPFEFASILLLVAMIGTVLLSKKEKIQK
jgi:NADH-quinone oxidoreductase subunit J